ncbi:MULTISPECIES: glycosyltransferase family 4 protein [unclassified Thioalkalivibrio]|uniref:glycosyltransferase family 4 protein n=1 Tax=unclassified Thioalkalivibrio TaxID=2621013 RepID=UPI00036F7ED6|nr:MULTISPECIES: glycosyltransferase family 4 protein [unclassified Thioalkalivibrio]
MRVLLLSRYGDLGASSRVRYLQYLGDFQERGWTVEISPLFSNAYLQALYAGRGRFRETVRGYLRRLYALLRARKFDVLIIEKELFPFLPAWFERVLAQLNVPYVVDYDDALFHRYDLHRRAVVRGLLGRKIDAVMRHSALVIAGNEYLADRARAAGAQRIEIIPTVVDTDRYQAAAKRAEGPLVVGWIGTPKTSRYLQPLVPVFERLHRDLGVRFVAVGARAANFVGTPVEAWPWSEETEVSSIQQFDIGIMPLEDSPWERGKCGYKLIQYMACGLPVVASPVGVNREIVEDGRNGFLASATDDWMETLKELAGNGEQRAAMGAHGRRKVETWYSRAAQAPRVIDVMREAAEKPENRIDRKGQG